MITLQDLYNRVIDQVNIDPSRYTTTKFLMDVHMITQDIWSEVVKKRLGNINWEVWFSDTVSLQGEYSVPYVTSEDIGADYVENVSISYNDEVYTATNNKKYTLCSPATQEMIGNWEYFLENQPKDRPVFFMRDRKIFIAPEPRTADVGVGRIKVTGVRSINSRNWTVSTTEEEMKIPMHILETIVVGCVWKASIFKMIPKSEVNDYKNDYLVERKNSIYKMEDEGAFFNTI